jgi:hypothetical protein
MYERYDDITSRIPTPPLWYDDNGVPRYTSFSPKRTGNIYVREAALIEIVCQECLQTFYVCCTRGHHDHQGNYRPVAVRIRENDTYLCGDPPRHGSEHGCVSGDSENSFAIRVLEYWSRGADWIRDHSLEIVFKHDANDEERIARGKQPYPPRLAT